MEAFALGDAVGSPFEGMDRKTVQFELSLDLRETDEGLSGSLSYASQLFDEATAVRIGSMFERIVASVADAPDRKLCDLTLLDDAERGLVTAGFNDTAVAYEQDRTVVDLFCDQAMQRPDAVAVVDGTDELSYRALDEASNRLARYLIGLGVGPENIVGVCLDRSADLIVSLLGIWKAGGAYLPLDPDYPAERLTFMVEDAGASLLLTAEAHAGRLSAVSGGDQVHCIVLDDADTASEIAAQSGDAVEDGERLAPLTPAGLAYVIYTSGSTGKPKGVMVDHGSAYRLADYQGPEFLAEATQRIGWFASVGFDACISELLMMFRTGACLVVVPDAMRSDGARLSGFLEDERIDALTLPPVLLQAVVDGRPSSLRTLVTAGETPDIAAVRKAAGLYDYINGYGPTETTVGATFHRVPGDFVGGSVPIGQPFANTQAYVVDGHLNPVPVGVGGELLIGGVQISRGYLGRSGLTSEKFIADPFSGRSGARLYRTGDVARWRPDGTLEFLGRLDAQVKIRGMRVELGEIEAVLSGQPGIAWAVVAARTEDGGTGAQTELVAYVVPDGVADDAGAGNDAVEVVSLEDVIDLGALRSALQAVLPNHMVPGRFVGVSHVPLTPSGKVDRKALPDAAGSVARAAYAPPRDEREALLCAIMRDVIRHDRLTLERVGIDDNFFDIGGHSIFAAQFAMRLEKALGEHVPVRLVFESPTVRALSGRLREDHGAGLPAVVAVDRSGSIPASFEQERMWLANSLHAGRPVYNEGLPLVLTGRVDTAALLTAVQGILDRYEVLRTRLVIEDGRLLQEIDPVGSLQVDFEDWSGREASLADLEADATARCADLIGAGYDLSTNHPCRSLVLKLSGERHVWCLATHHSVGDNWSLSHVMPADFFALYDAALEGREPDLPKIGLHYADYAVWQRSEAMSDILSDELSWWRDRLRDAPAALDLPFDRPRPAERDHRGRRTLTTGFDREEWRCIERYAVGRNGTPFMVFVAALSGLLSRLCSCSDIVVGTPHVMKPDAALWDEFGYFGNTLALRVPVEGAASFDALFEQARSTVRDAFAHQYVPFEEIVSDLGVKPSNTTPVFQVLVVMHAFRDEGAFARDDMRLGALGDAMPAVSKYDLTVDISPGAEGVAVSVEYATDVFEEATVQRLGRMLQRVVSAAVRDPSSKLCDLPLLDDAERRLVTAGFSDTAVAYEQDRTVVDLFCEQALQHPDAVAVVDGTDELSYRSLDEASNRLARYLIGLGVGPENIVGVCLDRSAELLVSLLGIWKAGGAYLPLDPEYPAERLALMVEDAGASLVLTGKAHAGRLSAMSVGTAGCVIVDDADTAGTIGSLSGATVENSERLASLTPAGLAYVIYTSGSTGKPKGVMVGHGSFHQNCLDAAKRCAFDADGCLLSLMKPIFDVSLQEFLVPLVFGRQTPSRR